MQEAYEEARRGWDYQRDLLLQDLSAAREGLVSAKEREAAALNLQDEATKRYHTLQKSSINESKTQQTLKGELLRTQSLLRDATQSRDASTGQRLVAEKKAEAISAALTSAEAQLTTVLQAIQSSRRADET